MPSNDSLILFDAGDTLISIRPRKEVIFRRVLAKKGFTIPMEAIQRAYRAIDFHFKMRLLHMKEQRTRERFYGRYNRSLLLFLGIDPDTSGLLDGIKKSFSQENRLWKPNPGVKTMLKVLSCHGYKLGIFSNWDDSLTKLLDELDISKFFSLIITSWSIRSEKPSRMSFSKAKDLIKKQIGYIPENIFYVGNDYELDLMKPKKMGWIPVLYDPIGFMLHTDVHRIGHMSELLSLLKNVSTIQK